RRGGDELSAGSFSALTPVPLGIEPRCICFDLSHSRLRVSLCDGSRTGLFVRRVTYSRVVTFTRSVRRSLCSLLSPFGFCEFDTDRRGCELPGGDCGDRLFLIFLVVLSLLLPDVPEVGRGLSIVVSAVAVDL